MKKFKEKLKKEYFKAYTGILSEEQIKASCEYHIKFFDNYLKELVSEIENLRRPEYYFCDYNNAYNQALLEVKQLIIKQYDKSRDNN